MQIIQEIGSYAGFAAVVGLAVLSALYFSQARDVKRLREWAGRAPEREDVVTAQPTRVVAQPVPKPPAPVPTPATAASAGAGPAVTTGPAAATPAGAAAAPGTEEELGEDAEEVATASDNGTEEHAAVSQDTVVHPPPPPPEEDEEEDDDPDREPLPEDFHEDVDDDELDELVPETGDEPAVAAPPERPQRPTISIGGRGPILPPYEESRPGGASRARRGGFLATPGRAVAVVGGAILALLVIGFAVIQLTGGDDGRPAANRGLSSNRAQEQTPAAKKKPRGIDPSQVRVAVLNATTVPGLAKQIGDSIERQGFQLGTVTNFVDQQKAESVVKYTPGNEREAADVGRRLKIAQREAMDAETQSIAGDATVAVIAGADQTR